MRKDTVEAKGETTTHFKRHCEKWNVETSKRLSSSRLDSGGNWDSIYNKKASRSKSRVRIGINYVVPQFRHAWLEILAEPRQPPPNVIAEFVA